MKKEIDILSGLTEEQRKVVTCKGKAILITGPAGSGKREVLKQTLHYLLSTGAVKPDEILCFSEYAEELRQSLYPFLGGGFSELWLSNFTAFSKKILRKHYSMVAGLYPNFRVIEGLEEKLVLKKVTAGLKLKYYEKVKASEGFIDEVVDFIDLLKLNGSRVISSGSNPKYTDLAVVFNNYNRYLQDGNFLDFRDLVLKTIQLFSNQPEALESYRKRFGVFILDEFQNIDINQYRLFSLLAEGGKKVIAAGNRDEGVFRFRGAIPERVVEEYLNEFKPVRIELTGDARKIPEKKVVRCSASSEEALFIARQVFKLTRGEYHYDDIAILCRGISREVRNLEEALKIYNVPHSVTGGIAFFKQDEIVQIIAILKLLQGDRETANDSITRALYAPGLKLAPPEVERLISYSERNGIQLVEAIKLPLKAGLRSYIGEKAVESVETLMKITAELRKLSGKLAVEKLVYRVFKDFGYIGEGGEDGRLAKNLDYFIRIVESFRRIEGKATFTDFMNYIDEILYSYGRDESVFFEPGEDTVKIMTVQHSRGRFYPVVFVTGLVEGKFPRDLPVSSLLSPGEKKELNFEPVQDMLSHMEEEKRVFNLACSRATEKLFMTFSEGAEGGEDSKRSSYVKDYLDSEKEGEFIDVSSVLGVDGSGDVLSADDLAGAWIKTGSKDLEAILKDKFRKKYELLKRTGSRYSTGDLSDRVIIPDGFMFSASKLEQYGSCPSKFFFMTFVHIWLPQKPQLVFGSVIHKILAEFHGKYRKKESLNDGRAGPYLRKLIAKEFSDCSFGTVFEKEVYENLAERMLMRYLGRVAGMEDSFTVEECEKGFRWKSGKDVFTGRIDRIDRRPEGGYDVIDYKTGKGADMEYKLCRKMKEGENFQLPIYYFAARESLKKEVRSLSVYWLRKDMEKDNTRMKAEVLPGGEYKAAGNRITGSDALRAAEKLIGETVREIRKGLFFREGLSGWECRGCDFKFLCDEK